MRKSLLALSGLFIWALHFGFVYGIQSVACGSSGKRHDLWIDLSIIAATVLVLLALLVIIGKSEKFQPLFNDQIDSSETRLFFLEVMQWLGLLSFFGVAWTAAALIILPGCISLS